MQCSYATATSNERSKRSTYIKSPVHIFYKIVKLNGVEFEGNKLIVEEVNTLPKTIYRINNFIESSNLLEPLLNIPSLLQNQLTQLYQSQINRWYKMLKIRILMQLCPIKNISFCLRTAYREKWKWKINSKIKGRRIHIKSFSAKKHLNHYVKLTLDKYNYNSTIPAGNYMLKVNNRNTRTKC